MKVKEFETKFSLEDIVWFMRDNKPAKALITRVVININAEVYIHGSEIPNIIAKIKNFFSKHKKEVTIKYSIDEIKNDKFYRAHSGYFYEYELFATKEELLKSL